MSRRRQVAEYLTFLRFRARIPVSLPLDTAPLAALYAEFEEEDRLLAEEDMSDYDAGLRAENADRAGRRIGRVGPELMQRTAP